MGCKKKNPVSSYFKFNRGKIYSHNNTCQKFKTFIEKIIQDLSNFTTSIFQF